MTLLTLVRQPVVPASPDAVPACEARSRCGPFLNQAYYDAFPDPMWHGMGDCIHCGTTRRAEDEVDERPAVQVAA